MTFENPATISIPFPEIDQPQLRLTAAPCRLKIAVGETEPWVAGTFTDIEGGTGFKLTSNGPVTHLTHDRHVTKLRKGIPQFDLALGTGKPFSLSIESGASDKNRCDLGGVQLTGLDFKQGAGEFVLDFSRQNPVEMTMLNVSAGAASLELRNLANSNAAQFSITGGVASFLVDFCGTLQRDMNAKINAGMAEVKISAPRETAIKLKPNTTLATMNVGDGFVTREGAYWSEAAANGETPVLTIELITALGTSKVWLV